MRKKPFNTGAAWFILAGVTMLTGSLSAIHAQNVEHSATTIHATTRLVLLDASILDDPHDFGSFAITASISDATKARMVEVRTLSSDPKCSIRAVAVSSSGAS